jgi:hypothetical protein
MEADLQAQDDWFIIFRILAGRTCVRSIAGFNIVRHFELAAKENRLLRGLLLYLPFSSFNLSRAGLRSPR